MALRVSKVSHFNREGFFSPFFSELRPKTTTGAHLLAPAWLPEVPAALSACRGRPGVAADSWGSSNASEKSGDGGKLARDVAPEGFYMHIYINVNLERGSLASTSKSMK